MIVGISSRISIKDTEEDQRRRRRRKTLGT